MPGSGRSLLSFTTGLDPQARRAIWELVTVIRARGTTVFLTTHLMEEAERLCDRVALMQGVWDGLAWGALWVHVAALIAAFAVCIGLSTKFFRWE